MDADLSAEALENEAVSCDVPMEPVGYSCRVDINSGDIQKTEYSADGAARTTISESSLSTEVRRLGIEIPPKRNWKFMYSSRSNGMSADGEYGRVVYVADSLVRILGLAETSDQDRRVILTTFMTSLRTEDAFLAEEEGYRLIQGLEGRIDTQNATRPFGDVPSGPAAQ